MINMVAVLWVCLIVVLFVRPPISLGTAMTMNHSSIGGEFYFILFPELENYSSGTYSF